MNAQEMIDIIEHTYTTFDLKYEMLLAHFFNMSGIGFYPITIRKNSPIYRARYSDKLTSYTALQEISYPEKKSVVDFSRLNRPSQNLFYGSESEVVCLKEMLPYWFEKYHIGDRILVTIVECRTNKDLTLIIIPDADSTSDLNRNVFAKMQHEEKLFWEYISKKFTTTTKEDKFIYEFTSAYSNALRINTTMQGLKCDGFIYSSSQSREKLNIALIPKVIDNELITFGQLVEIKFQMIGYTETGLPSYKEIDERKNGFIERSSSKIKWL
jgi:hypothetical protein